MSIESEKTAAINEVVGQLSQAGLSGEALTKATEIAAAGIVVGLDQTGQVVRSYRTYSAHPNAAEYVGAVLSQHGPQIFTGGSGTRSFQQMLRG